jgi:hypothetical protein
MPLILNPQVSTVMKRSEVELRIITVKCSKCNRKVFKYLKVGKGRLRHCWKNRIIESHAVQEGDEVKCQCGSLIGFDKGRKFEMKGGSFAY